MRRSSNTLQTQKSEPLIVIEDEEHSEENIYGISRQSSEEETHSMNPYLLSPYSREIRKHSLPTPQCSGITASQVRRLSERGENAVPGPRQAEFLATLSTTQHPSGGRRHSVVTISRVPSALFGRNRRESVAAFPSTGGFLGRILPNRRESIACPPSTEPRGSIHNLQLDIMDDILQARKVRMKMWNTSSERVCEVQPLDESGNVQRYTNCGRRFSEFVGTALSPISGINKRRASEFSQPFRTKFSSTNASTKPSAGIVCSNTDLISILHSLSTSASEINQCGREQISESEYTSSNFHQKRSQLKSNRSHSFDISILRACNNEIDDENITVSPPSNWFKKRHQPFLIDKIKESGLSQVIEGKLPGRKVLETETGKVIWDERSGSLVDPHALGSAIEVFLRQASPDNTSFSSTASNISPSKTAQVNTGKVSSGRSKTWFSRDEDSTEACDTSICSTLKDLFVK